MIDGRKMHISLLGFLESKTDSFMLELWALLLSAQESPVRVPAVFIEQKKKEMIQRQEEGKKNSELAIVRDANEREKEQKLEELRQKGRGDRGNRGGGGRGIGFGGNNQSSGPRDSGWPRRAGDKDDLNGRPSLSQGMRDSWEAAPSSGISGRDRRRDERPARRERERYDDHKDRREHGSSRRERVGFAGLSHCFHRSKHLFPLIFLDPLAPFSVSL